jgi:hypothetical protein
MINKKSSNGDGIWITSYRDYEGGRPSVLKFIFYLTWDINNACREKPALMAPVACTMSLPEESKSAIFSGTTTIVTIFWKDWAQS